MMRHPKTLKGRGLDLVERSHEQPSAIAADIDNSRTVGRDRHVTVEPSYRNRRRASGCNRETRHTKRARTSREPDGGTGDRGAEDNGERHRGCKLDATARRRGAKSS